MPYPKQYTRSTTTHATSLDPPANALGGDFVGNAHTFRVCAHDPGHVGFTQPPYAFEWTAVTFSGVRIQNTTNLGAPATFNDLTMAVAFRVTNMSGFNTILSCNFPSVGANACIEVQPTGTILINFSDDSTYGFNFSSAAGTVVPNVDYVLHVAARASTNALQVWLNGASLSGSSGWASATAFSRALGWSIGSTYGTTNDQLNGRLRLVWVGDGQYITNPAAFYPAYDLGTTLAAPGAQPRIGFGNLQGADDRAGNASQGWNDGFNQGNGTGTWTVTGSVT